MYQNGPEGFGVKMNFLLLPKWLIFQLNLVPKFLKLDIGFLRYGNFIDDFILDWWKVDFEKKVLIIGKSEQNISIPHNFIVSKIPTKSVNVKIDFRTIF